jgi:3-keto-5-aminohexanoate cleavage enzyme
LDEVMIEARLNEYTPRKPNPNIPFGPAEIAAAAATCRAAGAAVAHFHGRDPRTGEASTDPSLYCEIGRALRSASDIISMPTLGATVATHIEERIEHVLAMAKDPATRAELVPLDLASANTSFYDPEARRFNREDSLYVNTVADLRALSEGVRSVGVKPIAVIYSIPSLRTVEPLLETGVLQEPLYLQLLLTAGGILSGHPATARGLDAFLDFLPGGLDFEWNVLAYGTNLVDLADDVLERGGHFALGLGDYPYLELGMPTNGEVIANLVERARAHGREPATPDQVRDRFELGRPESLALSDTASA